MTGGVVGLIVMTVAMLSAGGGAWEQGCFDWIVIAAPSRSTGAAA